MSIDIESYRLQLGARIRAARKSAGLSQEDLASSMNIARGTLSRYERGDLTPPADVLAQLALALYDEITPTWLLFGDIRDLERPEPIKLPRFGTLVGFTFGGQGTAQVLMGVPEISRIIDACIDHENNKKKPDAKIIQAFSAIVDYLHDSNIEVMADIVIAQHAVRLTPIIPTTETSDHPAPNIQINKKQDE